MVALRSGYPGPLAIGVVAVGAGAAEVIGVGVSPGHRRDGVGGRVLDTLLVEAARSGAARVVARLPRGDAGAAAYVASRGLRVERRLLRRSVAVLDRLPAAPDELVVRTTRDSVSMGDDATAPNRREVALPAGARVADLLGRLTSPAAPGSGSTWAVRLLDADGEDFDDRDRTGRVVAVLPPSGAPLLVDDVALSRSCRVHLVHLPGRDPLEVAQPASR